jgi:hypothetical protein
MILGNINDSRESTVQLIFNKDNVAQSLFFASGIMENQITETWRFYSKDISLQSFTISCSIIIG